MLSKVILEESKKVSGERCENVFASFVGLRILGTDCHWYNRILLLQCLGMICGHFIELLPSKVGTIVPKIGS